MSGTPARMTRHVRAEYLSTYRVQVDGEVVGILRGTRFATPWRPTLWYLHRLGDDRLVGTFDRISEARQHAATVLRNAGPAAAPGERVICPVCRASVGTMCRTPDDRLMPKPHAKRLAAESAP